MFGKKGQDSSPIESIEIKPQAGQIIQQPKEKKGIFSASNKQERVLDYTGQKVLSYMDHKVESLAFRNSKAQVFEILIEKFNFNATANLSEEAQNEKINQATTKIVNDLGLPLDSTQMEVLKKQIIDDAKGFGPLEKLLADPEVSDIMINSARSIYVEKSGRIYPTDLTFSSESHLMNVIQKIISIVGRRVDESSPMVDARMPDGSRFNAIIPPLALDGAVVSIRKFKRDKMRLEEYIKFGSINEKMYKLLKVCAASRLNILISGGTGSGKTTMLNALSAFIDVGDRVITIEDAAELQLKQPHVLRLESRPPNMEGHGAITPRQLLKNSLRMRPDRIILGEIRGDEIIDVLQAMNTGHEGSMATIHSNNPRECMSRIENLFGMAGFSLPTSALRQQIANAVHLVVQVARMRDGKRRVTSITEVVGIEDGEIKLQEIFYFKATGMGEDGVLTGEFILNDVKPKFAEQISYYGLSKELEEALSK